MSKRPRTEANLSTDALNIKLSASLDETTVQYECIKEKYASLEQDKEREKERFLRQLNFYEEDNAKLKNKMLESTERYYEEKKRLLQNIRSVEAENKLMKGQLERLKQSTAPSVTTPPPTGDWEERFIAVEKRAMLKTREVDLLKSELLCLKEKTDTSSDVLLKKDLSALRAKYNELSSLYDNTRRVDNQLKNQMVLQDQIDHCNSTIESMQRTISQLTAVSLQYDSLVADTVAWKQQYANALQKTDLSFSLTAASLPPVSVVVSDLANSQNKCVVLMRQCSEHEIRISKLQNEIHSSSTAVDTHTSVEKDLTNQVSAQDKKISHLQTQAKCYEGEVKSLRGMLKSYDVELSLSVKSLSKGSCKLSNKGENVEEDVRKLQDMITLKNKTIEDYQKECDQLRSDALLALKSLENSTVATGCVKEGQILPASASEPSLKQQLLDQQVVLNDLRASDVNLRADLEDLQRASGTDFVPNSRTRVLHMVYNPSVTSNSAGTSSQYVHRTPLEEIDSLKQENLSLRRSLSAANAATNAIVTQDTVGNRSDISQSQESQDMNMSLLPIGQANKTNSSGSGDGMAANQVDAHKLNTRLKELFKERINSFREAVYLLTGYKVDLYHADTATGGVPRLRLRSVYAEEAEDCFLFQWKSDNTLELLDTPFASEKLGEHMFAYLRKNNSIPAFLSNVTLELYGSQTFQG